MKLIHGLDIVEYLKRVNWGDKLPDGAYLTSFEWLDMVKRSIEDDLENMEKDIGINL